MVVAALEISILRAHLPFTGRCSFRRHTLEQPLLSDALRSTKRSSSPCRQDLKPGFVRELMIERDIELLFVIASGLPITQDFEHATDLQILKVPPALMGMASRELPPIT
ncbi:hypothetical protein ZWY2020_033918 [Hordeum vulgare]|nr:hypothetical protein ZWY2020_033918 [Hordeum vulgare]